MKIQICPVTARQTALRSVRKTVRFRASHCLITGVAAFLWCGIQGADAEFFRPIAGSASLSISTERIAAQLDSGSGQTSGGAMILGTGDVVTIPEPGAIAMLLGGFGTLLGFQRLRRRH